MNRINASSPNSNPHFPDQKNHSNEKIAKIAAHVLLDTCIRNSGLEGLSHSVSIEATSNMLAPYSTSDDAIEEIRNQMKRCQNWIERLKKNHLNAVVQEIVKKGGTLLPGTSLLIPGGWKEKPDGHTMFYLLEREKTEGQVCYTFYIINTGAGISHHAAIAEEKEIKYLLARCYKNIPKQELFYGKRQESFFRYLLSFLNPDNFYQFDPRIIYDAIFAHLSPYRDDRELMENLDLFITPQRGGTCSFKSIQAFIRLRYFLDGKSPEAYKKLIFQLSKEAIERYVSYLKTPLSEQEALLLSDMTKVFAHRLKKEYKRCRPEELKDCATFLNELKKWKNQSKPFRLNVVLPISSPPDNFKTDRFTIYHHNDSYTPISLSKKGSTPLSALLSSDKEDIDLQLELLNHFQSDIKGFKNDLIDALTDLLSLKPKDWMDTGYISKLSSLMMQYHWNLPTPRNLITVLTHYYLLWLLLPQAHQEFAQNCCDPRRVQILLKKIAPPKNLFQKIDEDPFFIITDPKESARFGELRRAFEAIWNTSKEALFLFETPCKEENFHLDTPLNDELKFYRRCFNLLKKEVQEKKLNGQFSNYVSPELEGVAILATSLDPWEQIFPSFFTLLRLQKKVFGLCFNPCSLFREGSYHLGHDKGTLNLRRARSDRHDRLYRYRSRRCRTIYSALNFQEHYFQDDFFPFLLRHAFSLKSLKENNLRYLTYADAIRAESDPLERTFSSQKEDLIFF